MIFIFAALVSRKQRRDKSLVVGTSWPFRLGFGALSICGLGFFLSGFRHVLDDPQQPRSNLDALVGLAGALASPQVIDLVFEVSTALLLVALVGAIYVDRNKK